MGIYPILTERIYETIAELNQQGMTILLVEQNANFALEVSQRAYVLETGRGAMSDDSASPRTNPEVQKASLGTAAPQPRCGSGPRGWPRPSSRRTSRAGRATRRSRAW